MTGPSREGVAAGAIRNSLSHQICRDLERITANPDLITRLRDRSSIISSNEFSRLEAVQLAEGSSIYAEALSWF
jgi:hypothetical protein